MIGDPAIVVVSIMLGIVVRAVVDRLMSREPEEIKTRETTIRRPHDNGLRQIRGEYIDEHTPVLHWDDSFRCWGNDGCGCLWRRLDGDFHRCNRPVDVKYVNPRLKCARASCEECNGDLPKFRGATTPIVEKKHELGQGQTRGTR